jgi:hypothetical protein
MGQKKKKRRGGRAGPKERRMAGWAKRREEGKRDTEEVWGSFKDLDF